MELTGTIIYIVALITAWATMLYSGIKGRDWRYWVITACVFAARMSASI